MHPTEMNALIMAITNHLYCTLSQKEFVRVNVFLSEISKSMCSLEQWRGLCQIGKGQTIQEELEEIEELEVDG